MAKQRGQWVYRPRKAKGKIDASIKTEVQTRVDDLIETVMKPNYLKPPPEDARFNYIVDIYGKWWRNYFYFCSTYHCPGPNAISPSFEAKFTRLEYLANGNFNLAYMRHTGQWQEVYMDLTLDEAFESIQSDPFFMP